MTIAVPGKQVDLLFTFADEDLIQRHLRLREVTSLQGEKTHFAGVACASGFAHRHRNSSLAGTRRASGLSFADSLDVGQLPRLVEEWLPGTIQAEHREKFSSRRRVN